MTFIVFLVSVSSMNMIQIDGSVIYFHGKKDEHFSLVSDLNLQINARFTGLRPAGRTRDYTWIQALGLLFDSNTFSIEATKSATWNNELDHLKFSYNGKELVVPEVHMSRWEATDSELRVERTSSKNSVTIVLAGIAEVLERISSKNSVTTVAAGSSVPPTSLRLGPIFLLVDLIS